MSGKMLSIGTFVENSNLSESARNAVVANLKDPHLAQERFEFDQDEFRRIISFKSIELSNGGILTAPLSEFDDVFQSTRVVEEGDTYRFVTKGRIQK